MITINKYDNSLKNRLFYLDELPDVNNIAVLSLLEFFSRNKNFNNFIFYYSINDEYIDDIVKEYNLIAFPRKELTRLKETFQRKEDRNTSKETELKNLNLFIELLEDKFKQIEYNFDEIRCIQVSQIKVNSGTSLPQVGKNNLFFTSLMHKKLDNEKIKSICTRINNSIYAYINPLAFANGFNFFYLETYKFLSNKYKDKIIKAFCTTHEFYYPYLTIFPNVRIYNSDFNRDNEIYDTYFYPSTMLQYNYILNKDILGKRDILEFEITKDKAYITIDFNTKIKDNDTDYYFLVGMSGKNLYDENLTTISIFYLKKIFNKYKEVTFDESFNTEIEW